eukprot:PhF_6_TR33851/c0_g1_i2/m.49651/K20372/TBC1D20, GYP8; TBC1 domain family member 20
MTKKKSQSPLDKSIAAEIRELLKRKSPTDIHRLRTIAVHHGLVENTYRQHAWLLFLGEKNCEIEYGDGSDERNIKDQEVLRCDIDRSLWGYVPMTTAERLTRRKQLQNMILGVLRADRTLCYYQGLHDIGSVLLLCCGDVIGTMLCHGLFRNHIREFLYKDLTYVEELIALICPIVNCVEPDLGRIIQDSGMDGGHWALGWIITWFAHDIDDTLSTAARVFDFVLATDPLLMPLYMAAALVIQGKESLLALGSELDSCMLHVTLMRLSASSFSPQIFPNALDLFERVPPHMVMTTFRKHPEYKFVGFPCPVPATWGKQLEEASTKDDEVEKKKIALKRKRRRTIMVEVASAAITVLSTAA